MFKSILEKYGDKIKIKKTENLLKESDFKEIEIMPEYDARTLRNIQRMCTVRKKDENGEWIEDFDKLQYNSSLIQQLVRFDGKQLERSEIERLEKTFFLDLVKLLTAQEAE